MRLSQLQPIQTTRDLTDVFGGYNHNPRRGSGEWFDMEGMTGDKYPLISTREPYLQQTTVGNIHGMYAGEQLVTVKGTSVYYGSKFVGSLPPASVADVHNAAKQQIVGIGAYICFFPAKMWFKYTDENPSLEYINGDYTGDECVVRIGASVTPVSFTPTVLDMADNAQTLPTAPVPPEQPTENALYVRGDGGVYKAVASGGGYIYELVDMATINVPTYWIDPATNTLKYWSPSENSWAAIPTAYIKLSCSVDMDFDDVLHEGDGVWFKHTPVSQSDPDTRLGDGYWYINKVTANSIIITGQLDDYHTLASGTLGIYRDIPTMDFVVQMNNRLWGCSSEKHEIYACKLGDPRNWHCFAGLASDSYAVTIGSDGDFTGMAVYLGKVYAFKENHIHKVFGTMPSNFETTEKAVKGVAAGCSGSIVVMDDYLYYVSTDGVCRYDGSLPAVISQNLGNVKLTNAYATALGKKLYLFADAEGEHRLYVYNAQHGFWHLEHRGAAKDIAVTFNGEVYAAKDGAEGYDVLMGGNEEVEWYLDTGKIMLTLANASQYSLNNKYIAHIALRLKADMNARVRVLVAYGDGQYEPIRAITGDGRLKVIVIRLIPRRADHVSLRIEGNGACEIYSMQKVMEIGSEVYR